MDIRQQLTMSCLAGALSIAAVPASAVDNGFYAGAAVEYGAFDEDIGAGINLSDETIGYRVLGGYQLNKYFAVELGYIDFGSFADTVSAGGASARLDLKADGFEAAAAGRLPVTEKLALTGRVGLLAWDAEARVSAAGSSAQASDSGEDLLVGVGAEYVISSRWTIAGGYTRYRLDDIDIDAVDVGFRFRF